MKWASFSGISRHVVGSALCLAATFCCTSCGDGDYDHVPPPGQGSIIIDNGAGSDAEVYLDGTLVGEADAGEETIYDLAPGVYRLVLAEEDGDRNYRNDIDVLDGRLTILDVTIDYSDSSLYYVVLDFEKP